MTGEDLDAGIIKVLGILYLPACISSMFLEPNQNQDTWFASKNIETVEKNTCP